MSRLIDADKVNPSEVFYGISDFAQDCRNAVIELLNTQSTVDAEPVVRCRECKHNPELKTRAKGMLWCRKWQKEVRKTDFCSYGEREDGK